MLEIPQTVYDQLRQQGAVSYPNECCGILIGTVSSQTKLVTEAIPVPNDSASPRNRYEIASLDLWRVQRRAQAANQEILGFYHSHPDHSAQWSSTDLAEAHWLGCSYVITAIEKGKAGETGAFYLAGTSEEDKQFEPEPIVVA